ncbi:cytochrome b/b6 domain-containing protein [Sedimentimonas flavescens]|uniref:cytochrome b/b6 domain-containing protein n=1 Tax=Sedimentimonas flavescens TaxID=2851012 RepID=UPI001C4A46E4|nr:cytochrome b/b6 domain-containing protein [Sedimentimonas flavescens]MBW0157290.1 cytochrome b/b6 domain-containing protein [Sedimentimonas flavescens]
MLTNTSHSYGSVARIFHWLTALLILSAIGLGLYAEDLPRDTDAAVATLVTIYSAHKTIGVAAFFTALARILWSLAQPKPAPLHPERRAETFAAELIHWALYGAMLIMPLSGWIGHAAQAGFAPILWPFGQTLPFVPQSTDVAHLFEGIHKLSALVLYAAIGLHVLGALKHVIIDRDATMARMTRGTPAGEGRVTHGAGAPLAALAIWAAVIGGALPLPAGPERPEAPAPVAQNQPPGNWKVSEGTLDFTVQQMGAAVSGSLPAWTAQIDYDEASGAGSVTVQIDTTQLTLGAVTDQAKGAEFFDTATFPIAAFTADLKRVQGNAHEATGTLTLRGASVPLTLPFALSIAGDQATMTGEAVLDRRAFGMGESYPDESTVGFSVTVQVTLSATRQPASAALDA